MIEVITVVWNFFLDHFWSVVACIAVLFYGRTFHERYIFTPLAGGNGKIQMDELAKGVLIAILLWSVNRDGYRVHEWTFFSDAYYAALIAGLFAIAAIKPAASILKNYKNGTSNTKLSRTDSTDSIDATGDVDTEDESEGAGNICTDCKGTTTGKRNRQSKDSPQNEKPVD